MFNSLLNICKVLNTSEQRVWHNIIEANTSKKHEINKFKISLISKNFVNKNNSIWREISNFQRITIILCILNYKITEFHIKSQEQIPQHEILLNNSNNVWKLLLESSQLTPREFIFPLIFISNLMKWKLLMNFSPIYIAHLTCAMSSIKLLLF